MLLINELPPDRPPIADLGKAEPASAISCIPASWIPGSRAFQDAGGARSEIRATRHHRSYALGAAGDVLVVDRRRHEACGARRRGRLSARRRRCQHHRHGVARSRRTAPARRAGSRAVRRRWPAAVPSRRASRFCGGVAVHPATRSWPTRTGFWSCPGPIEPPPSRNHPGNEKTTLKRLDAGEKPRISPRIRDDQRRPSADAGILR